MAQLDLLNEFWAKCERTRIFPGYAKVCQNVHPFSLENDLAAIVSELAFSQKQSATKLVEYLASARLPFGLVWIECDYMTAFGSFAGSTDLTLKPPERVGWIIRSTDNEYKLPENALPTDTVTSGFEVTRIAWVESKYGILGPAIYPVKHIVSYVNAGDDGEFVTTGGTVFGPEVHNAVMWVNSVKGLGLLPWGLSISEFQGKSLDELNVIAAASPIIGHSFIQPEGLFARQMEQEPSLNRGKTAHNMLTTGLKDQLGDLAFVVAALALINEVPVKIIPHKPVGRLITGGRTRPYLSTNVVQIAVPASRRRVKEIDKHLRGLYTEAQRKRHEVRGYFRHVQKLPERNPERYDRATHPFTGKPCWRTWVDHHLRGSAALGWVDHHYNVSAKSNARSALNLPSRESVDTVRELV